MALLVGCMALPSTFVSLCHSSQMALTTHAHFLLHNTNWMARGPGDLPSCIGWLFCDHSFSFPFPATIVSSSFSIHPFFSRPLLHGCLDMIFWDQLMVSVIFHPLSSYSSGWWFECFNSVKSPWNSFSPFSLFVQCILLCNEYITVCSITIVKYEYCFMDC